MPYPSIELAPRDFNFEDRPSYPQGQHVARVADITLASAHDIDFDDPTFGFDLDREDGMGGHGEDLDLGIDFGDGPVAEDADKNGAGDETMSVEVGRDAASFRSPRASIGSHLLGKDHDDALSMRSREQSEHNFGNDMDLDFGPDVAGMELDLGLDFGDAPADVSMAEPVLPEQPGQEKEKSVSRACQFTVV